MNVKRAAIALLALLALTGCAEVGSLAEKAQIDLALNNLTTELDASPHGCERLLGCAES